MANIGRGRNAAKARGCRPVCKGVTRWLKNPVFQGKWDDHEIWLIDTDKNTASKIVEGGGDHFGPIAWAPDVKRFACVRMPDRFSTVGLGMRIEVFDATTGKGETVLPDFRLDTAIAWPDNE
jgi:hypothetical protein